MFRESPCLQVLRSGACDARCVFGLHDHMFGLLCFCCCSCVVCNYVYHFFARALFPHLPRLYHMEKASSRKRQIFDSAQFCDGLFHAEKHFRSMAKFAAWLMLYIIPFRSFDQKWWWFIGFAIWRLYGHILTGISKGRQRVQKHGLPFWKGKQISADVRNASFLAGTGGGSPLALSDLSFHGNDAHSQHAKRIQTKTTSVAFITNTFKTNNATESYSTVSFITKFSFIQLVSYSKQQGIGT